MEPAIPFAAEPVAAVSHKAPEPVASDVDAAPPGRTAAPSPSEFAPSALRAGTTAEPGKSASEPEIVESATVRSSGPDAATGEPAAAASTAATEAPAKPADLALSVEAAAVASTPAASTEEPAGAAATGEPASAAPTGQEPAAWTAAPAAAASAEPADLASSAEPVDLAPSPEPADAAVPDDVDAVQAETTIAPTTPAPEPPVGTEDREPTPSSASATSVDEETLAVIPAPRVDLPTGRRTRRKTERTSLGPTGRAALIAAVLVVPLTPLAFGIGDHQDPPPPATTAPGMPSGTISIASNAKVVSPTQRPARPVAAPSGLSVPSIGLNVGAPEQLGLDPAGQLAAPADFNRIGWYRQGPKPGEAGPAVIVGHVDSFRGPAVFFRLSDIRAGQQIVVPRTDGRRTTFTVDAVKRYPKDEFPSDEVYGPTANAQLRLITCGGAFDRGARSYEDNIVVFASVH